MTQFDVDDVAVFVVAVCLEFKILPLWYPYMYEFLFQLPPLFFIQSLSNLAFW